MYIAHHSHLALLKSFAYVYAMLLHILQFDFFINPIIGLCFAVMVCYFIFKRVESRLQSLPGPTRWPVVGNIPDLAFTRQTYRRLLEFRDKYGDIVQLRLGPNLTVVAVFGHKYLYELLVENGDKTKYRPSWLHLPKKLFKETGRSYSLYLQWCFLVTKTFKIYNS